MLHQLRDLIPQLTVTALRRDPDAALEEALEYADSRAGNRLLLAADLPLATDRAQLLESLSGLRCQTLLVN